MPALWQICYLLGRGDGQPIALDRARSSDLIPCGQLPCGKQLGKIDRSGVGALGHRMTKLIEESGDGGVVRQ